MYSVINYTKITSNFDKNYIPVRDLKLNSEFSHLLNLCKL